MQNVKLIMLDLDGTLLLKESEVPSDLDEVIHKLNEKGVMLGIATGRYYGTIKEIFKDTYKEMTIVSNNGASIYHNGKHIFSKPFEEELYKKILDASLSIENKDVVLQPMNDDYILMTTGDPLKEIFDRYKMPVSEIADLRDSTKGIYQMCLMTLSGKEYDYDSYYKNLKDECEFMPSGFGCMDIMPKGITKATGIRKVAELLDIPLHEIMAMGDAMNDYEMLKTVGVPVAMKNADQRLKDIATYVTDKTNSENGCLDFIRKYFGLD